MTKKILIGVLVVAVLAIGLLVFLRPSAPAEDLSASGTGPNHYQAENFFQGLFAGTKGQFKITNAGNIVQTVATAVNQLLGTTVMNNVIFGASGFSTTYTTTSTVTIAQFCGATSVRIVNTTGSITLTLPAATTSFVGCGGAAGGWSNEIIVNDSTNTVFFAGGTGTTLKYQTTGVGTSTVGVASSSGIIAGTVAYMNGIYDTSSSLYINVGPAFK